MSGEDKQLKGIEAALAALRPEPSRVDRDRVMFLAGRASRSPGWGWPLVSSAALLLAAWMGGLHYFGRADAENDRSAAETELVGSAPIAPPDSTAPEKRPQYLRWRDGMLARQRDAWPDVTVPVSAATPPTHEPTLSVGSRVGLDDLL